MARNIGRAGTRTTGITTAVSFQNLVAATTIDTVVRDISVSYDGTVVTNAPNDVSILFATSSGTFPISTPVPQRVDNRSGTALIATANYGIATVEPTGQLEVFRWHIHPQTGLLWQGTPFMDEIVIVASKSWLVAKHTTAPAASIDVDAYYVFEE
jgi:hypothetical protein